MTNYRQLRLEAAHRELGSRHPLWTIAGRRLALVAVSVLGLAAGVVLVQRGLAAVSHWWVGLWDGAPSPAVSTVSVSVPVSGLAWWVWVVVALVGAWLAWLIRNRFKFGFWTL